MPSSWSPTFALKSIGSLIYQHGDDHENVASKVNLRSFNLYSNSFTFLNTNELFLSRIPKNHIQVQIEKENLAVACLRSP